jgi:hypothetical protein
MREMLVKLQSDTAIVMCPAILVNPRAGIATPSWVIVYHNVRDGAP